MGGWIPIREGKGRKPAALDDWFFCCFSHVFLNPWGEAYVCEQDPGVERSHGTVRTVT